jgi:hypothetical protein
VSAGAKEPWAFAMGDGAEGPLTSRIRTRRPSEDEKADYPRLVMIRWQFDADQPHLPDDEDLDSMAEFENTLDAAMDAGGWGLMAAVVTRENAREWRIYTPDFDRFQEGLNDALMGQPRYPLQFELYEDADWDGYDAIASAVDWSRIEAAADTHH